MTGWCMRYTHSPCMFGVIGTVFSFPRFWWSFSHLRGDLDVELLLLLKKLFFPPASDNFLQILKEWFSVDHCFMKRRDIRSSFVTLFYFIKYFLRLFKFSSYLIDWSLPKNNSCSCSQPWHLCMGGLMDSCQNSGLLFQWICPTFIIL